MKSFLNFLFFTIVLSLNTKIYAQNEQKYSGLYSYKSNSNTQLNLKDSVKAVYFKFNEPKKCLLEVEREEAFSNNLIKDDSIIYFDKFQRIIGPGYSKMKYDYSSFKMELTFQKKNDYSTARHKRIKEYINNYEYIYKNDNDWLEKSKYKTALKQYYPVWNRNLLLKLNEIPVTITNSKYVVEVNGKIGQIYREYIYSYIYDKQGRISEEKQYNIIRTGIRPKKKINEDDLFTRKLFFYNEKGQVVKQLIIAGPQAKGYKDPDSPHYGKYLTKSPDYFRSEKSPSQFYADMGTKCLFYEHLQLRYTYDSIGRITQVALGSDNVVAVQDYTYHPTKDYVETVKCFTSDLDFAFKGSSRTVKTFNEQGDMIKIESIPDVPQKNNMIYYYSYEYDSHNNWIKCNMYMEGTNLGDPTLVAERRIEYY